MDWSVLKPHATYPLLRSNLLYTSNVPVRPLYLFIVMTSLLTICSCRPTTSLS